MITRKLAASIVKAFDEEKYTLWLESGSILKLPLAEADNPEELLAILLNIVNPYIVTAPILRFDVCTPLHMVLLPQPNTPEMVTKARKILETY